MKLLIITQVIDTEHPILGFFHRWVEEFAKHCEHVHVICLQAGKHSLPQNVTVHSLGKEAGKSRLSYLIRFYQLMWSLRHEYDSVFVHMNQIYVVLGGLFWRLMGKKVGLWYAHGAVTNSLRISTIVSHLIFTSTEQGFQILTPKRKIVGQGIDTLIFTDTDREVSDVLQLVTVGRISQSKNIETLLQACASLRDQNILFHFNIIGVPTTSSESIYAERMYKLTNELQLDMQVTFVGAVSNHELPRHLQQSDIFIHDGSTNSLDKTLIEAALCGCVVVSSNPAYRGLTESLAPEYLFPPHDQKELADSIKNHAQYTDNMLKVKAYFKENFSIDKLVSGIVVEY
jgi:glycosyltransferase involved in cell wall biosynthesis